MPALYGMPASAKRTPSHSRGYKPGLHGRFFKQTSQRPKNCSFSHLTGRHCGVSSVRFNDQCHLPTERPSLSVCLDQVQLQLQKPKQLLLPKPTQHDTSSPSSTTHRFCGTHCQTQRSKHRRRKLSRKKWSHLKFDTGHTSSLIHKVAFHANSRKIYSLSEHTNS